MREKVAADAASGDPWAPLLHDAIDRKLVPTSNATICTMDDAPKRWSACQPEGCRPYCSHKVTARLCYSCADMC